MVSTFFLQWWLLTITNFKYTFICLFVLFGRADSLPLEIDQKYNLTMLTRRKRQAHLGSSPYSSEMNQQGTDNSSPLPSPAVNVSNGTEEGAYLSAVIYDMEIVLTNLGHFQEYNIEVCTELLYTLFTWCLLVPVGSFQSNLLFGILIVLLTIAVILCIVLKCLVLYMSAGVMSHTCTSVQSCMHHDIHMTLCSTSQHKTDLPLWALSTLIYRQLYHLILKPLAFLKFKHISNMFSGHNYKRDEVSFPDYRKVF